MASKSSWVYWLFRLYALCVVSMAVLHVVAWTAGLSHLHRIANYVLAIGFGLGSVPVLAGIAHSLLHRLKRGS